MVPAHFVVLDSFPMTVNGKVAMDRLPPWSATLGRQATTAPSARRDGPKKSEVADQNTVAIVAELASAMGATVRAESPVGVQGGARFEVTLASHHPQHQTQTHS